MSRVILVCGRAWNSAQVQHFTGRGPTLSVNDQSPGETRGVGPAVRTGNPSVIPPRVRADPFAARRSQALRASPQWVRAKARWYQRLAWWNTVGQLGSRTPAGEASRGHD